MIEDLKFGSRESFAIELGFMSTPQKYKLCFWVNGKKMGSFTKGGELHFSIKAISTFLNYKEDYYLPEFDKMTPTQINKYLVNDLFILGRSSKPTSKQEYERRKKLHLFFGPQFSNDGSDIIVLYNNGEVIFIYTPPKKTIAEKYIVGFEIFFDTCNKYITYCAERNMV